MRGSADGTGAASVRDAEAPPATLETLDSLDLRPAFIGVNSALAREAIQGDVSRFRPAPEDAARTAGQILDDTTPDADMDAPAEKADTAGGQRHVGARVIRLTSRTPEGPVGTTFASNASQPSAQRRVGRVAQGRRPLRKCSDQVHDSVVRANRVGDARRDSP